MFASYLKYVYICTEILTLRRGNSARIVGTVALCRVDREKKRII
jgi:hypothetical protein